MVKLKTDLRRWAEWCDRQDWQGHVEVASALREAAAEIAALGLRNPERMWMVKCAELAPCYGISYTRQHLLDHVRTNFRNNPPFGPRLVRVLVKEA